MPTFTLYTNVSREKIPCNFLKETSSLIAKTLGKPESYVIIHVVPDQIMTMGGTDKPCGSATLMSIGQLGIDENKKHSAQIYKHVEENLGIPQDRMYITYKNEERANVGYSGTTFHEIFGGK